MIGGVGRVSGNGHPYPIYAVLVFEATGLSDADATQSDEKMPVVIVAQPARKHAHEYPIPAAR